MAEETTNNNQRKRFIPQNELELNLLTTEPSIGKINEISSGLKARLSVFYEKAGKIKIIHKQCKQEVIITDDKKTQEQYLYCLNCEKKVNPAECIKADISITEESLWDLLSFFTRDLRLANLSDKIWNNEIEYCTYYLDLAHDCLMEGHLEPFVICLERVTSTTEISQSKGGFLRKRVNTATLESVTGELEPKKGKSLFSGGK